MCDPVGRQSSGDQAVWKLHFGLIKSVWSENANSSTMPENTSCPECGAELPANAPQGLCPRCLASMALQQASCSQPLLPAIEATTPPFANGPPAVRHPHIHYFGDYELLEEIARGGMGVVYRARQVSLNRIVAVKMLLFGKFSSDEFVKRFQSEAAAAASLHHPNIVAIHEIGDHEGQHYFSMDYVEGKNLADLVRDGPLPSRRAAVYLKTLAEAIHYAHDHGVLHRDLKPSNVLIDPTDQPCITDFGLAKQLKVEQGWTTTGHVLGSPSYLPPEQAVGKRGEVGTHSDVYSLGSILYHLLTGRPPFVGETIPETLHQVLHDDPVSLRLLNPSVPRGLEAICLKCLRKDPRRRYGAAKALADDLECFLQGSPISARPAGIVENTWRWCRRNPTLAALVLLLVATAAGATWTALRLQRYQTQLRENLSTSIQLKEVTQRNLYISEMNAALRYFLEGNTAQAFKLLQAYIPTNGCQVDLRGLEWRYLWGQCRGNYSRWLPEQKQIVGNLQLSPDGQRLGAYAWNNVLTVWNLATEEHLVTFTNVTSFSGFTADGELLIGREGDLMEICQAETGVLKQRFPAAGGVAALAAKAQIVATIDADDMLRILNLTNGLVSFSVTNFSVRKWDYGLGYPVALSADGTTLAVVERNQNPLQPDVAIWLWDLTSQKEPRCLSATRQIRSLAFSPGGEVLAVGDGDGKLLLWKLASPDSPTWFEAHEAPILSLAFSPDGQTLATGSSDKTCIRLWSVAQGTPIFKTISGQVGDVWSLATDGRQLISGTRDGRIRIWNLDQDEAGEIVEKHLYAHEYGNFIFSPDSKWMAGGCDGNIVKIWDAATLQVRSILTNATYVAAFSKDSQSVLVSTMGGSPHWENLESPVARAVPSYKGNLKSMIAVDLTADRRVAALGLESGSIQLLELESGRATGSSLDGHQGAVRSLAFSPAGDKLASGGSDNSVILWDMKTGKVLGKSSEHKGSVCAVAISPNGETLASGCGAETVKLWSMSNISTGAVVSISYHKSVIRTLAFSPDGRTLASGSEDKTVKLWNVALRREVASFKHEANLRLVVFSPDGNTLASVTDKGTLRVFRAPSLQQADFEAKTLSR